MSTLLGTLRFLNQQRSTEKFQQPDQSFEIRGMDKLAAKGQKKASDNDIEILKPLGSTTPMITPTFCLASPILPEIFSTDAVGLQSLLPEAEFQAPSRQLSLRTLTETDPQSSPEDVGSLFKHMTQKSEAAIKAATLRLKRRSESTPPDKHLEKKLKTDSCKSLMLPQDTPPFSAGRKPAVLHGIKPLDSEHNSDKQVPNTACPSTSNNSNASNCGSSCHQCKSRRALNKLYFCSNQGNCARPKDKRHLCRKKYCDQCLEKFYHENPPKKVETTKWFCPACRGLCCCAACRRQKAKLLDDPRTMSPATSLACGLVFGDMLDVKHKLTLEEAQASVNKGVQKRISLQKKIMEKNATAKKLQLEKEEQKRQKEKKLQRQRAKAQAQQKKQQARKAAALKKAQQKLKKQAKRQAAQLQKQQQQQQQKLKQQHALQPQIQVATAQVATAAAAAAAAAAAVAARKGQWFQLQQQQQQVQLLAAKLNQHSQQQNRQLAGKAKQAATLQAQLVSVATGRGLQRGFVIPA
mmetsp:Transcript_21999/g.39016  ORF Transcript_21999/g.39016 Transcript_21999/m.39016 type:complete len:522 (+) Transcript_21999:191-1756(+)|eukprot:CAMPEP_0197520772 /NCGR_PEP_ID=MMETSP1318-20131121/6089_1 /TAXON_ID=552666 /ORGANISM="Partenskyella glossopodia, Strain RCC365" /LENGTH=521 /DNA_ID=CAMNT_0043072481 /DNA_START=681 /DNA_END=2246 /DNA_ORIENTATION=-